MKQLGLSTISHVVLAFAFAGCALSEDAAPEAMDQALSGSSGVCPHCTGDTIGGINEMLGALSGDDPACDQSGCAAHRIPGMHKTTDITLKRGTIGNSDILDLCMLNNDGCTTPDTSNWECLEGICHCTGPYNCLEMAVVGSCVAQTETCDDSAEKNCSCESAAGTSVEIPIQIKRNP